MVKRLLCISILIILFILPVSALNISVDTGKEFQKYQSGEDSSNLLKTINMSKEEFDNFCTENHIVYFATDKTNQRQVRISVENSEFSNSIGNLSNLSNDKISQLISNITGTDKIKGEILEKNGQKFIKTNISTNDSGGKYSVIQYITVAGKNNIILSFYTSSVADSGYIEKTFNSFKCEDFINSSQTKFPIYRVLIIIGFIIFFVSFIFVTIKLIKDIKN